MNNGGLPPRFFPQMGQPQPISGLNIPALPNQDERYPVEVREGIEQPTIPIPPRVQRYPEIPVFKQFPAEILEDYGRQRTTIGGQGADILRLKLQTIAENLALNVRVIPSWESAIAQLVDPWAGVVDPALPADLPNQIEAIARLSWGHDGANNDAIMNVPCGQAARMNVIASWIKVIGDLVPKYGPTFAISAGPPTLVGFLSASDNVRNNLFNFPQANALALAGLNTKSVEMVGWGGKGTQAQTSGPNDVSARPQRRFFGFIPAGTAQGSLFRCPIAESGTTVNLVTDFDASNFDPAGAIIFSGVPLRFHQVLRSGQRLLNYTANTKIPLRADCVAIDVFPPTVGVTPARTSIFELIYDLGF